MALALTHSAQGQQAFPTGVELIAVDVTGVDRAGSLLSDLAVADFELRVGGKTRRVVSAQLVRHAPPTEPGQLGAPRVEDTRTVGDESRPCSTNREAQVGRLIVLVPDVGSLSVGGA